MVKHVDSKELENLISTSDKAVFCDFWASWCGPCRMLAPVFEELSEKYDGQAEFVKVDVDENEAAAMKYKITSIPNVMAFKNGKMVASNLGFVPAAMLEEFIKKNM